MPMQSLSANKKKRFGQEKPKYAMRIYLRKTRIEFCSGKRKIISGKREFISKMKFGRKT